MYEKITSYEKIGFDNSAVSQDLLNISKKTRSNLFAWTGQFSPQFIEVLLDNFAHKGYVVADPFLGSGTVLYECARKGFSATGSEINPSAYYMAKVYEYCVNNTIERHWAISQVQGIVNDSILQINPLEKLCASMESDVIEPTVKNTLCLLIVLLDLFHNTFSKCLLLEKWDKVKNVILSLPESPNAISAYLCDARRLPLESNSIDMIVTSPPYINVFNYHQKFRRSVEALGYDILAIARKEIGSNRKNRSNRLLTIIQYCIDMAFSIREMSRICKDNSRIILIVGRESNVLSTSFSNSQLVYEVANGIFGLPLILKQERVFKNRFGQNIYEDILHFRNTKTINKNLSDWRVREIAQDISIGFLRAKMLNENLPNKLLPFFVSAIDKAKNIIESEGLK